MSRKVIILLGAIVSGCGGGGGSAPLPITAEALREGSVGATLDVLLGAADLLASGASADAYVRGEPVTLVVAVDGDVVTVEAIGSARTEATLVISDDPELGLAVSGTILTESPDGTVVEGTLERVVVRAAADLPGIGAGALFISGNVDLAARDGDAVLATGTAALFGRRALISLSIGGSHTSAELALGQGNG